MKIHTIGDSHCYAGWNKIRGVNCHHLGPVLAYSFGRDKLARFNIKDMKINENDIVIFCFGEIDCRIHVDKYITAARDYKEVIEEIVLLYISGIDANVAQYNTLNVCVYNVVPPPEHPIIDTNGGIYSSRGTPEERKQYVQYFNTILARECAIRNYIFIDIYKYYTNKKGFLNTELSDGWVHINESNPLKYILNKTQQQIVSQINANTTL